MPSNEHDQMQTRASLLLKLKQPDSQHWQEFYDMYANLIFYYALSRGCNESMAKDVQQESLLTVYKHFPDFDYDKQKGQFRSWLLRIVHSRLIDAYRREKKYTNNQDLQEQAFRQYENESYEDFKRSWDKEWRKNLVNIAMGELKHQVQKESYKAFKMITLEEKTIKEVEQALGMNANQIYQIRSRLLKKLTEITERLKDELGD